MLFAFPIATSAAFSSITQVKATNERDQKADHITLALPASLHAILVCIPAIGPHVTAAAVDVVLSHVACVDHACARGGEHCVELVICYVRNGIDRVMMC